MLAANHLIGYNLPPWIHRSSVFVLRGEWDRALLDAQRTWQQARISLISASASRHADSAALFLALGGGWWNRNGNEGNAEQSAQARP